MKKEGNWFQNELTNWYSDHKRDLPWRTDPSPYKVWLSEIIFQQTRIDQGLSYYHRFLDSFDNIEQLARAKEEEVLKLWQGLGYYSRARNLHKTARIVQTELGGKFPDDVKSLKKLPGIGDYTAGAIASIAFNKKESLVDGNVYRLFARFFAIEKDIGSNEGKRFFKELADHLVPDTNPGDYNQALMDFGATVCTPSKPSCNDCILQSKCEGLDKGLINSLPKKIKKGTKKDLHLHYFILDDGSSLKMTRRTKGGIWKNLFELPNFESPSELSERDLLELLGKNRNYEGSPNLPIKLGEIRHELSHRRITASYYTLDEEEYENAFQECENVPYVNIKNKPVSSLMVQLLKKENYLT